MTLHKLSNVIFNDEVHSHYKTVNTTFETRKQKEHTANDIINKQLQALKGNGTNTVPTEIDNCGLNKTEISELERSENKTYRAILIYITDDGYIIPGLKTMLSLTSQSTPINNKNYQAESQNRPASYIENKTVTHYTKESLFNHHDDYPTLHQFICNEQTGKRDRRWINKEDARTERKLRFQIAKLFFQKYEQNELGRPQNES